LGHPACAQAGSAACLYPCRLYGRAVNRCRRPWLGCRSGSVLSDCTHLPSFSESVIAPGRRGLLACGTMGRISRQLGIARTRARPAVDGLGRRGRILISSRASAGPGLRRPAGSLLS
jgi:hypothetical protein